jgi:class 3 adenylate cyclase
VVRRDTTIAYVGATGPEGAVTDFTALGDAVNTAGRIRTKAWPFATERVGGLWSNCAMEHGERLATHRRLPKGA